MILLLAVPCFVLVIVVGCYLIGREAGEPWFRGLGGGLLLYGVLFAVLIVMEHRLVWWLIGVSLAMTGVDVLVARHKIIDFGESFWPDLLHALFGATVVALLFALPIIVAIALVTGVTPVMIALLLATIALAVAFQILATPLQQWIDQFAFRRHPQLQTTRAVLRATADALPRNDDTMALMTLDDDEFAKLTRRALTYLTDLPRLAASPLSQLPAIDARLVAQQQTDNTLTRSAILRDLLVESITQLKPDAGDERNVAFDSSDAWRHYNALYFPYVIGLKPYSRRAIHDGLDPAAEDALSWFQAQVPERTLYNWQTAAAKLVAQHLRELK